MRSISPMNKNRNSNTGTGYWREYQVRRIHIYFSNFIQEEILKYSRTYKLIVSKCALQ